MAKTDPLLKKMRAICLALPDTKETPTWGKPHFRVGEKIFAGYGEELGRPSIGFKLAMDHARRRVREDPRCEPAPYVGHKGWVSMAVSSSTDWEEVRALVDESYRLIAPKRSIAKLPRAGVFGATGGAPPDRGRRVRKRTAHRTPKTT